MGRYLIGCGFLLLFCAVVYLGAVVAEQQRAIEALVVDHLTTMQLQNQLVTDIQSLRQEFGSTQ